MKTINLTKGKIYIKTENGGRKWKATALLDYKVDNADLISLALNKAILKNKKKDFFSTDNFLALLEGIKLFLKQELGNSFMHYEYTDNISFTTLNDSLQGFYRKYWNILKDLNADNKFYNDSFKILNNFNDNSLYKKIILILKNIYLSIKEEIDNPEFLNSKTWRNLFLYNAENKHEIMDLIKDTLYKNSFALNSKDGLRTKKFAENHNWVSEVYTKIDKYIKNERNISSDLREIMKSLKCFFHEYIKLIFRYLVVNNSLVKMRNWCFHWKLNEGEPKSIIGWNNAICFYTTLKYDNAPYVPKTFYICKWDKNELSSYAKDIESHLISGNFSNYVTDFKDDIFISIDKVKDRININEAIKNNYLYFEKAINKKEFVDRLEKHYLFASVENQKKLEAEDIEKIAIETLQNIFGLKI